MKNPLPLFVLLLFLLLTVPAQAQEREVIPDVIDRWVRAHEPAVVRDAVVTPAVNRVLPRKIPVWQAGGIMTGTFSYYGKRPTDGQRVYAINKGLLAAGWPGPLIAVIDCARVGSTIWIDVGRGWEAARAIDCQGADAHIPDENGHTVYDQWVEANWLFEIDYYTAQDIGVYGNGLTPGRMSFKDPL